jgi:ParB family chromosome partitioning protein
MGLSDSGLGRSVSDVLAKTIRRAPENTKGYLEVDLGLITPSKTNPRTEFDQAALDELAASIRLHGVLQPIVVLKRDVGYEIISGERRYRAARQAGLAKVPVVVREESNPQHLAELRLVENIQRENLNPIELATAYQALLEQHSLTHEDLAARVNKDRSSITNTLRLLGLPNPLREAVARGELSLGHAKALLGCADTGWQRQLADRAIAEGLSVRETERLAKAGPPKAGTASGPSAKPAHLRELETNLYHLFGARVEVQERGQKGRMTVHFDGKDQFQRVVAIMERFLKQAKVEDRPKS